MIISFRYYFKQFVSLSLLLVVGVCMQAQVNLDSLWQVWNDETAPDSSKLNAMNIIATKGYLYSKPDSAFYFAQMMYVLAEEKGLKKEMVNALNLQGVSYYFRSDYPKALEYYQRSYNICEEIPDKQLAAKMLNNIGIIYSILGDYPKCLEYYHRSLDIKEEISDSIGMATVMSNIGIIYLNHGDYPRALNYFQRSLKIREAVSDDKGIAPILNNIGLIYKKQGIYPQALDCFQRSMKICEEISDKRGLAGSLTNIGLIYMNQNDYPKALDYHEQSLKINEEISDMIGIANSLNNLGDISMFQGDYPKSMDYYHQSLKIKEEISDKRGIAITLTSIGRANNKQGNYAKAIKWCNEGLNASEEINVLEEQKNACQCLYTAYKAIGNDNKALEYHERITMLDDSLKAAETSKQLQQMEFAQRVLADSLLQEKEKLRIQAEHDAEVKKKNNARNIFLISAVFLLFGAAGLYSRNRYINRAKSTIENEKGRSDKLLLNILPADIADELKEKGQAHARDFDQVSVLFTDFKGFTQTSEKLSAEELVEEINSCFKPFDAICAKYGIEKIKTIGDAYMAAGGIPVPDSKSVKNTVLAGIEMAEFMMNRKKERDKEGKISFKMRVGIHTGPVIAGIVGVTKFQYDIWGDTVNTASRMENSGKVGKVNISHATYELIKDDPDFNFQSRGEVKAKYKGVMEMWFVEKAS